MATETDAAPAVTPADAEVSPVVAFPLEGEQLKLAIMKQFEFYFSPENTANDAFLVSQMDNEKYVGLSIVAGFGKVKQLTEDLALIVEALEPSVLVELDAAKAKVRAVSVKPSRTTLALRQVDPSATSEALTAVFEEGGFKPTKMRSDIGNFWFADFASEEETTKALEYIRTQKFADKPIRARIKTSTVLSTSSYYYPAEPVQQQQAYYPGFVPMGGAWVPAGGAYAFPPGFEGQEGQIYLPYAGKAQEQARSRTAARGKGGQRKDGARKGQAGQREDDGKRKAGRKGRAPGGKEVGQAAPAGKRPDQKPPQLTPAHFPPLPNAQKGGKSKGSLKKYSADELVAKMQALKAEKPADLPEGAAGADAAEAGAEQASEAIPSNDAIQSTGVTLSEVVKSSVAKSERGTASSSASADGEGAAKDVKSAEKADSTNHQEQAPKKDELAKPTWSQMVRLSGSEDGVAGAEAEASA